MAQSGEPVIFSEELPASLHKEVFESSGGAAPLEVEIYGDNPQFAFSAGIHRHDEPQIIGRARANWHNLLLGKELLGLKGYAALWRADPNVSKQPAFEGNLNRAFARDTAQIRDPRAALLVEFRRKHPQMKYLFSWHMDDEGMRKHPGHNDDQIPVSFYMYYNPRHDLPDPDREFVNGLQQQLMTELERNGIDVFTGTDDIDDESGQLGALVERGFLRIPDDKPIHPDKPETAWENYFVRTERGESSFVFEVPQWLPIDNDKAIELGVDVEVASLERITKTQKICLRAFVVPFLQEKGLIEKTR